MDKIAVPTLRQTIRDFADLARPSLWMTPPTDPDLPRGDGHAVLFAPGIGCNDLILASVVKFFRNLNYDAQGWQIGINLGPTKRIMRRLEERLFALNDRSGRRVSLYGKSLGGMVVREIAKKHPNRVRRLILVCAPVQHPVATRVAPLFYALRPLFDSNISSSDAELSRPAPVPTTALYTKNDGLVAWQCTLEQPGPLAENIELHGAYHARAASRPQSLRIAAERLALPDRAE